MAEERGRYSDNCNSGGYVETITAPGRPVSSESSDEEDKDERFALVRDLSCSQVAECSSSLVSLSKSLHLCRTFGL